MMLSKRHNQAKHYKRRIEELSGEPLLTEQLSQKRQGKLDKVESARQTRLRKKIYISLLEQKLRMKQQQIEELQSELSRLRVQRPKPAAPHPAIEALKYRTDLFSRIEQCVRNQDQQQTRNYLDVLRLRYGVGGEQRKGLLESALRQFLEFTMPMHFRYLLESCNEKKQFYELFAENEQYRVHMNFDFLELSEKKELAKIRPLLCQYKHSYNQQQLAQFSLIDQLHRLKQLVLKQNELSQSVIDGMSKAFKPCFVAQFLLKLDQKRNVDKKFNSIYPISYWEALAVRRAEQEHRRALGEIESCNVSEYRAYDSKHEQMISPEQSMQEPSQLNFLL